jgi:two-component system sensor histidine kinase UhpB
VPRLDPEIELVVYRIAQEGLTNALRHAHATHVLVELHETASGLHLTVADDGRGLPPGETEGPGLRGMRERALLVGAHLEIDTSQRGVTVKLDLDTVDRPGVSAG